MPLPGRLRLVRPLRLKAALRSHAPSCPPPGRPRAEGGTPSHGGSRYTDAGAGYMHTPWRTSCRQDEHGCMRKDDSAEASGTMFDLLAGKKAQLRSHNAFQVEAESATRQLRLWLAARDDRSLSFDMPLAGQQIAWRMTHKNEKRKPHHCSSAGRALGPMVQQARWLRHGARYPVRCWSQPARLLAASAHPPTDFGNVAAAAAGRAGARRDAGHRCGSRGLDIEKVGLVHYYDVPS